jgi:hypothetical protein
MARAQGAQANAKEDTVYLALGGALTTDLSQLLTNLTASGAGAYEAPSARSILTGARTVSVRWLATAAEANLVLLICGNAAQTDMVWAIGTEVGGKICFYINGVVGVLTSTAAVAAKDYTVSVSTRANPDTTGPSDRQISEMMIWNHTDGVLVELLQATHALSAAGTGPYNLSVGGWWNGGGLTGVPTNAPTEARVSTSHHPHVEELEDWIGARVAYAGTADDGPAEPLGPIPASSGLGDESQLAGRHPWGYVAAHALGVRHRSWSPILNEILNDTQPMPTAQLSWWAAAAPGDPRYTMDLAWLRWCQAPEWATHVRVRIHVRQWVTAGAAVPVGFRCYGFNRPHTVAKIGAIDAPTLEGNYREQISTVDDELGPGVWLDLGPVAIPRFEPVVTGWTNTFHLALAYAIDPNSVSGNDAAARFVIDAWVAVPAVLDVPWRTNEI